MNEYISTVEYGYECEGENFTTLMHLCERNVISLQWSNFHLKKIKTRANWNECEKNNYDNNLTHFSYKLKAKSKYNGQHFVCTEEEQKCLLATLGMKEETL